MSRTVSFKCPACGGYLEFDPDGQQFECRYCGHQINEEELQKLSQEKEEARGGAAAEGGFKAYHCQMCGAEIVTGDTTAATRCYYCHQPVVLADRLDAEFRPDGVIPFRLDKKGAEDAFKKFVAKKTFIDKKFFSTAQLEDFSGVYYPYWYGDVLGEATLQGSGTRSSTETTSREYITRTRHYRLDLAGHIRYFPMVRKGLNAVDRTLSEGIHPYNLDEIKPFASGYLSGFLAERRDVEKESAQTEMERDARKYADDVMRDQVQFDQVSGDTSFNILHTDMRSLLLPAWVLTYKGKDGKEPYYYMMNGQTGEVCGKLPINKGKLYAWAAGIFAAVTGLLCLGGALLW